MPIACRGLRCAVTSHYIRVASKQMHGWYPLFRTHRRAGDRRIRHIFSSGYFSSFFRHMPRPLRAQLGDCVLVSQHRLDRGLRLGQSALAAIRFCFVYCNGQDTQIFYHFSGCLPRFFTMSESHAVHYQLSDGHLMPAPINNCCLRSAFVVHRIYRDQHLQCLLPPLTLSSKHAKSSIGSKHTFLRCTESSSVQN